MSFSFPELFTFLSRTVDQWGYWVVFLLVFLETSAFVGVLVPGESILLVAGALASQGHLDLFDLVGIAALAALLGDNGGYLVGRLLGRDFLLRHRARFHIRDHHLERADRYFDRFGGLTIFVGRWIGFLRTFSPFLAGSAHMSFPRFFFFSVIGAGSWALLVVLAGFLFGRSYGVLEDILGQVTIFLVLFIAAAVLLYFFGRYLWRYRRVIGRPAVFMTDLVLEWEVTRALRRRFHRQIGWFMNRFSPNRAYGLALTIGLVFVAFFSWVFGSLVQVVLTRAPITALDRIVMLTLHDRAIPAVTRFFVLFTHLGEARWVVVILFLVALALVVRRKWMDLLVIGTSAGGAAAVTAAVKGLVGRVRPNLVEPLAQVPDTMSFPSGHATVAIAFYMVLGIVAAGWTSRWETRIFFILGGLVMAFLLGFSRLYLGVHYLTDVVAGYAIGAVWATVAITAGTVLDRARKDGD